MLYESAGWFLDLIAGIATAAWLAGAVFTWTTAARLRGTATGEVLVATGPQTLIRRAQALLQNGIPGSPLSEIELLEVHQDALVWRGGSGRLRHTASLRAAPARGTAAGDVSDAERSSVAWQAETQSSLVTAAHWLVAVAGLAVIGLYLALSHYVLASPHPAVRYQVLQMAQAVHFLWPPFLLAGLARMARARLVRDLERSLRNVGFDSEA